jgi:hypothetical protein
MPTFNNDPVASTSAAASSSVSGSNTALAPGGNGGWFESSEGEGVRGHSKNRNHGGVVGTNDGGGDAVFGESSTKGGSGVKGVSHNANGAVVGVNDFGELGGNGGWFQSAQGEGVRGVSENANHGAVVGVNTGGGFGVYGKSDEGQGVVGESNQQAGVFGRGPTGGRFEGGSGPAVDAVSLHGGLAGRFDGNVEVTGDLTLAGADYAEALTAAEPALEPGTVVVINEQGEVEPCRREYDTAVAGVVSGGGGVRAGGCPRPS